MNALLDAIGELGYLADTPGAYLRGALAGRPGERASGQDLLSTYGLSSQDDPWGGVKGFGVEAIADPLALAGPVLGAYRGLKGATRGLRGLAGIPEAPLARRLGELGAGVEDPLDAIRLASRQADQGPSLGHFLGDETGAVQPFQEIGRRTDPDVVNSLPWYHGTATPGLTPQALDPMKTDPSGLFGRGIYKTASPEIAGEYADARLLGAQDQFRSSLFSPGNTRKLMAEESFSPDLLREMFALNGQQVPDASRMKSELPYLMEGLARQISGGHMVGPRQNPVLQQIHDLYSRRFGHVPVPERTIYQAGTDYGNILDLDEPASPGLIDILKGMLGPQRQVSPKWGNLVPQQLDPADTAGRMIERVKSHNTGWGDLDYAGHQGPGDPLIQALREGGYDALSHTGGLRAGGGRNLHQVLIGLDPNDTISRVGRANQITRFDPQNIEELLRRFRGG